MDRLASRCGEAIDMEDYCHSTEHSIEFQVLFLQRVFGGDIRILPILCGSYAKSFYEERAPEGHEPVKRFIGELGEIGAELGDKLFWILGVDMAHIGRRYGDKFIAIAGQDVMAEVEERDRERIKRINEGDAEGFWELVRQNQDDLKWCGSAPFLYIPARRAQGTQPPAELRAMEHRRAERCEFRCDGVR